MGSIKVFVKKFAKKMGYNISKVKKLKTELPSTNLYTFFTENQEESENFMSFIYGLIVKEGDYVIDVGANHGYHTIPLSTLVGKTGKVIACEAI